MAVAGPLVTFVLIVASASRPALAAPGGALRRSGDRQREVRATPALVWLSWLATINVFVLVFNLIPAFPLDGGQIAQALIWWRTGDRNRATRWTGRAGQGFAVALGLGGLALFAYGYATGCS